MAGQIAKLATFVVLTAFASPVWGQNLGVVQSLIVTADSEKVFGSTVVGRRITSSLENQVAELASENRRIAADLEAEELALTEQRQTIEPAEFRVLANNFDEKVKRIRSEQDAKQRDLQNLRDEERQAFIDAIGPILSSIARRHGALVVLERRTVLLSADSIDITQEVIDAIEATLGGDQPEAGIAGQDNDTADGADN